jgi:nicotinamidase-related amidase
MGKGALVLMDLQKFVVGTWGPSDPDTLILNISDVAQSAREADWAVIWVVTQFRPGHPDVADTNAMMSAVRENGLLVSDGPGTEIHAGLKATSGDVEVVKRRVSAFAETELAQILRARRINNLVLAGVSTSGVVLSTVRAAADLDFQMTVLSDCCGDPDQATHDCLVENVFPAQAAVMTSADWVRDQC